jgi:hypothetical protein
MEKVFTISDIPSAKGTFVIIYEGGKPIDSGIIIETQESQAVIVFKSASKKEEESMPLAWNGFYNGWSPSFEDPMTGRTVFSSRGACYSLIEDDRRIPIVVS